MSRKIGKFRNCWPISKFKIANAVPLRFGVSVIKSMNIERIEQMKVRGKQSRVDRFKTHILFITSRI